MKEVKKDILWRVYLVYIAVLLFSLLIIGKVMKIQFIEGDEWKRISYAQTMDTMKVEAIRGNICAEDGSLLATSVPIFDIYWDSQVCTDDAFNKNIDSLGYYLADMFKDKSKKQYVKLLTIARDSGEQYVLLHRSYVKDENSQISYKQLKKIKTFPIFRLGKNRGGLIVEQKEKRVKPYQVLAKRTIGYLGNEEITFKKDSTGKLKKDTGRVKVGLEGYYSDKLEGTSGIRLKQKIAGGVWMPMNENEIEPQDGNDVITTIDVGIQDVAENALMKNLVLNDADHGCAILMEVSTGHIKAIANLKRGADGTFDEEENYAVSEATEPGSTFKLFSLVAALDDGKVNLDDKVAIGKTKYYDRPMEDSHINGYGPITVRKAFEISSNVGISQAIFKAYKDNPLRFTNKLNSMRVDTLPLGLDIGGEAKPVIKSPRNRSWSKVTLPWMSIGYEVALTPLQILTFYNAIANNGKMVKPQFVKEIRKLGKVVESFKTEVLRDSICSKKTVALAKSLLEGVVENGTAKHLKNSVYKIAGKTGTAQIARGKKGYGDEGNVIYKASFVGYFPADDPKYSCIVVVNEPSKGAYYGGAVAAPVFKEIADRVYATHTDILQKKNDTIITFQIPFINAGNQKDLFTIYKKLDFATLSENPNAEWVSTTSDTKNVILKEKLFRPGIVPDVVGMGLKDAIYMLESAGLKVRITGKGKVVKQSISPGTGIKRGSFVTLDLAKSAVNNNVLLQKQDIGVDSLKIVKVKDTLKKNSKTQSTKVKSKTDQNKKQATDKNKSTTKDKASTNKVATKKDNNTKVPVKPKETDKLH